MKVTYYSRRPTSRNFSIERVFQDVVESLPANVQSYNLVSRYPSRGLFSRVYNILEAPFYQGDINHVTGDVHYLTYLLDKKRTLLTVHDCVSLNRTKGLKKLLLFLIWYWLPSKCCQLISVISNSTRDELLQYLPEAEAKIRVVPNPVSSSFVFFQKEFDSSQPVLLQVGTGPNKNLIRVCDALRGIPCHLRIVGKLSNKQIVALERNFIQFSATSNITDLQMVEEYRNADIVIFVSTYEGFGLPILEAQATGRPVITSNMGPMPEVAGGAAHLVDPYDVNSIRVGLQLVMGDKVYRDELIRKGRENASKYHPHAVAQQYCELYQELLVS
ncbi:glycosyltransferase [bacterium]|nr:glycosyltransferase [bacterium]